MEIALRGKRDCLKAVLHTGVTNFTDEFLVLEEINGGKRLTE